jgi:hypothetical protein
MSLFMRPMNLPDLRNDQTAASRGEGAMTIIVAASPDSGGPPLAMRISSIARLIADCIKVMAEHYAAAAKYEQLSRLSDAELKRRGLSRENLARAVRDACDRGSAPERLVPLAAALEGRCRFDSRPFHQ